MAESLNFIDGTVDLHTHTLHSDGELTTEQLLSRAVNAGVGTISITDHDSVEAYIQDATIIENFSQNRAITVVPGIEVSSRDEQSRYHILGIDINPFDSRLHQFLANVQDHRTDYTIATCDLLQKDGWHIDTEELLKLNSTLTKAHIARMLLADSRNVDKFYDLTGTRTPTEGQLLEATIAPGRPWFIQKKNEVTPKRAIDIIHTVGGVAILAHPSFYIMQGQSFADICAKFIDLGIDGFEAINIQYDRSHDDNPVQFRDEFTEFANSNNLLTTGGSDFHSSNEAKMGKFIDVGFTNHDWYVPPEVVDKITERAKVYKKS